MGSEMCELVWLYLLNQSSTVIDKSSVGLYRDDERVAINNANGLKLATKKYFLFQRASNTPFCLKWSTRGFQVYVVIKKN